MVLRQQERDRLVTRLKQLYIDDQQAVTDNYWKWHGLTSDSNTWAINVPADEFFENMVNKWSSRLASKLVYEQVSKEIETQFRGT